MAQRGGYMLAAAACEAMRGRKIVEASGVAVSRERVGLERIKLSPAEVRWCEEVAEASRRNPPQGQVDGLPDAFWAESRLVCFTSDTPAMPR